MRNLEEFGTEVTIYDPWANPQEVKHEYNLETTQELPEGPFDAIVLTVAHKEFLTLNLKLLKMVIRRCMMLREYLDLKRMLNCNNK